MLLDLRINDGFAKMILLRQIKKSSLDIFLLCPNQTVIVVCVFNRDGLSLSCTKRFLNTFISKFDNYERQNISDEAIFDGFVIVSIAFHPSFPSPLPPRQISRRTVVWAKLTWTSLAVWLGG